MMCSITYIIIMIYKTTGKKILVIGIVCKNIARAHIHIFFVCIRIYHKI